MKQGRARREVTAGCDPDPVAQGPAPDVLRLPPPTEESTIAATCALLPPLLAGEVADRAALCQETIDVLLATLPRCPAVVPALLAALPAATPRQCDAVAAAAAALVGAEGAAEGLVEGGCRLLRAACDGADGAAEKLRAAVGLRPLAHCLQRHLANVAVQEAGLLVLQLLCPPADPEDTQLVLSLLLNACHLVSDSDHGHPVLLSPIVALTATLKSSTAPTPDFLPPDLSAALRAIHTTLPPQHPMHDPLAAVL